MKIVLIAFFMMMGVGTVVDASDAKRPANKKQIYGLARKEQKHARNR